MIPTKIIGSVIKRYTTDGHSPYLVLDEDYDKIILKTKNNINDTISIQKEYLCSLFLDYWKINKPELYLCNINPELYKILVEDDPRFKLSDYYFGCEFLENQFELNSLFSFTGKRPLKNFSCLDSLIHIALFDIWIENDDRKPTNNNLLCNINNSKFEIYPIDHAFTFASLSFDILSPKYLSFSDNDSILYSDVGISIVKSLNINDIWLKQLKESFYLCTKSIENNIEVIFNTIPSYFAIKEEDKRIIKDYLFSEVRLEEAFNTLLYIITDIRK
ncbi:hypothetical protein OBK23_01635 [Empedobacter falsenii]|uniref:HipA family kinase n=1 Tax=Empedobacter falsenii TaxID=343874 RepID=UPI003A806D3B